jgi:hypothetical protein
VVVERAAALVEEAVAAVAKAEHLALGSLISQVGQPHTQPKDHLAMDATAGKRAENRFGMWAQSIFI